MRQATPREAEQDPNVGAVGRYVVTGCRQSFRVERSHVRRVSFESATILGCLESNAAAQLCDLDARRRVFVT